MTGVQTPPAPEGAVTLTMLLGLTAPDGAGPGGAWLPASCRPNFPPPVNLTPTGCAPPRAL